MKATMPVSCLILLLLAAISTGASRSRADVTITEQGSRLMLENDTVKVAFNATMNYVPYELALKHGENQNLIKNNFCLYYQYIDGGTTQAVNEGYPGGSISNGRHTIEKTDAGTTLEFQADTPHFHLTRRVTVPASGPVVTFVYELQCRKVNNFDFTLPYAPLSPKLNKLATSVSFIGADGRKAARVNVEDAVMPALHAGARMCGLNATSTAARAKDSSSPTFPKSATPESRIVRRRHSRWAPKKSAHSCWSHFRETTKRR